MRSVATDAVARADLQRKLGNTWREERAYIAARQSYGAGLQFLGEPPPTTASRPGVEADERRWWRAWLELQLEIVQTHYWVGESELAVERMDDMRTRVERYATAIQRVHFFMQYATLLWQHARFAPTPQTIAYLHEAQGAVAESSEAQQTPSIIFRLGFLLLWHDMLAEAEAKILAALASAERSIDLTLEVRCLIYLGVVYRRQNRPDDVRASARVRWNWPRPPICPSTWRRRAPTWRGWPGTRAIWQRSISTVGRRWHFGPNLPPATPARPISGSRCGRCWLPTGPRADRPGACMGAQHAAAGATAAAGRAGRSTGVPVHAQDAADLPLSSATVAAPGAGRCRRETLPLASLPCRQQNDWFRDVTAATPWNAYGTPIPVCLR